jgi:glycerol-3-phosphate dehydrogenase
MSVRLARDPATALAREYDLAIVGGGISGVSIAREAAGHGLRVLLLEQDDFGSGTSAATTKFLHGGIRYLEHGDVALVRECLRERRYLAQAAPHLVRRVELIMPAYAGRDPSMAKLALGCKAYDLLGWDRNRDVPPPLRLPATLRLDADAVRRDAPYLDGRSLHGGWVTHDYQNLHPERLLLELLKTAVAHGAVALNHTRVLAPLLEDDGGRRAIAGLEVEDRLDGRRRRVRVRCVVDAAGPWTGELLRRQGLPLPFSIRRVKGIHILVPRLGGDDLRGVYTRVPSGKHVVIAPWQGMHFIGPTDSTYDGPADALHPVQADLDDLLATLDAALRQPLDPARIRKITIGVRPLIDEPGRDSAAVSRRHRVYDSATLGVGGLYAAAGGKWSASRALAADVLAALRREPRLGHVAWRGYDSTRDAIADGYGWACDPADGIATMAATLRGAGLAAGTAQRLATVYGRAGHALAALLHADPALVRTIGPDSPEIAAQVRHAVENEAARRLEDVLDRRLLVGTLGTPEVDTVHAVAAQAGDLLGWDAARTAQEIHDYHARRWLPPLPAA